MKHLSKGRKFGLKKGPRKAFLKILINNFVKNEKIVTTEARAKEIRSLTERLISYGKRKDLAGLRLLLQKISKPAAYKIQNDLALRYMERKGGYTRITKLAKARINDASKMARIEFI